ncbi:MAG: iron chelate uptake ABC transporter family permease subunit [Fusobacteriaceae bacterium]
MNHKYKLIEKHLLSATILMGIIVLLMMFWGINSTNGKFLLNFRGGKILAILLSGSCIGISTVIFQTITKSRILTPSIMGLDSLYVFLQTLIIFFFKYIPKEFNGSFTRFFISVFCMIGLTILLQKSFFRDQKPKILYLILIGMVGGTFLDSLSNTMQIFMNPDEFLILQSLIYASYSKVEINLLLFACSIVLLTIYFIKDDLRNLDVLALGYENAINLGLDYNKLIQKFFIVIGILVSVSTALVGPITFLGLLTVNLAKEIFPTYMHKYILQGSIIFSVILLLVGQFLVEKIFGNSFPVSIIINLLGGSYLLYMILKERKVS